MSDLRTSADRPTGVTVVGGGIAGLVAAIEVAEAGKPVRLLEARHRLGGRATSGPPPWTTNLGPHALYVGTELWSWLHARKLQRPVVMPKNLRMVFVGDDQPSRMPPPRALRALLRLGAKRAPVTRDLRSWATDRWDADVARVLAGFAAPLTFDHDPGRLAAAFVAPRIRDVILRQPPAPRYVVGGWSALVDRLADHARSVGVEIDTDAKVEPGRLADLQAAGPVIVAVEPGAARRLLGDDIVALDDRRVAMLDVGLVRRRGDPFLIFDLDRIVFSTRVSAVVPAHAQPGHDLMQLSMGMQPGETLEAAEGRIEATLDAALTGWRDRTVWRRRAAMREATGAVDLPGTTWRDRPAVTRGDGLWLAGDWVAAPGHLAAASVTSAHEAAAGAVATLGRSLHALG